MAESFGTRLRKERERRQIPLTSIVEDTKIALSLLEGLERDDVSHWPSGIFRRGFIRAYAQRIGFEPDAVIREFLELYPDPDEEIAATLGAGQESDGQSGSEQPPTRLRCFISSAIRSRAGLNREVVHRLGSAIRSVIGASVVPAIAAPELAPDARLAPATATPAPAPDARLAPATPAPAPAPGVRPAPATAAPAPAPDARLAPATAAPAPAPDARLAPATPAPAPAPDARLAPATPAPAPAPDVRPAPATAAPAPAPDVRLALATPAPAPAPDVRPAPATAAPAPAPDVRLALATPAPASAPDVRIAPATPAPEPAPDLSAAAQLCTQLGRVLEIREVPPLLEGAAKVLDAAGLVVWVSNGPGTRLRPALAYGYSDERLAHMPSLRCDADNATATAFRSAQTRIVNSSDLANGAVVIPLMTPSGCVGVLAAELRHGGERSESVRALATIFAAQLATLVGVDPLAEAVEAQA